MTIPLVRKRARHAKVRSGCLTCKARRIKCDEARPSCAKCISAGKQCAGYEGPPSRPNTQIELRPKAEASVLSTPVANPSSLTSSEGYALDYFRTRALESLLPGSNWLLGWDQLILPLCQTEPAVVHATVALGSLGRALECEPGDHMQMALVQYNRTIFTLRNSIEALHRNASTNAAELILTVCLLLFSFDTLQGNDAAAFLHLRNGLKILFEHAERTQSTSPTAGKRRVLLQTQPRSRMDLLAQTFIRLDADLATLQDQDPYLYATLSLPVPDVFKSLSEAMVHLDALERESYDIWGEWFAIAENKLRAECPGMVHLDEPTWDCLAMAYMDVESLSSSPELDRRAQELKQDLTSFMNALAFVPASHKFDAARALVDIHFFFLWALVCEWRDRDLMEIDRFEEQFGHMIHLIEQYLELQRLETLVNSPKSSPGLLKLLWRTRPAAVMGTNVGVTLCLIVELCRTSVIRRKAVQLIRSMDMRGHFDGDFLASYYEAIIDLEENWARAILGEPDLQNLECHQVPAEARLIECDISDVDMPSPYYHCPVGQLVYAKHKNAESSEFEIGHRSFTVTRPGRDNVASVASRTTPMPPYDVALRVA